MKKLMLLLVLVISFFSFSINVKAEEKIDKITLSAAFEKDVDISEIPEVRIILEVIPANGNSAYAYSADLKKEKNYQITINNKVLKGEVDIDFVLVFPDVGYTMYDTSWSFSKIDEDNYVGIINVKNKIFNTSSTADPNKFKEAVDNVLNNDYKTSTTHIISTSTTTKNSQSQGGITPSGDPVPEEEPDADPDIIIGGSTTTTKVTETTTIKSIQQEEKEAKEKAAEERRKKEDLIFNIMLIVIGAIVLVGLTIAGIKIYKASKLI